MDWQTLSKSQVGLDNVDNTADMDKPLSDSMQLALGAKVNKTGGELTGQVMLQADNFSINNVPIRFRYNNMGNGEDSKGAIIEWGGVMQAATSYSYGVATNEYAASPGNTFTVPGSGYKKWAWITTHYDSPTSTGEAVHQHLNLETTHFKIYFM
jgi:hypothetical protein